MHDERYRHVRLLRRSHVAASALDFVDAIRRQGAATPGTVTSERRQTLTHILEETAALLITPLCGNDVARARQVVDWSGRPDVPRTVDWLANLIDKFIPVWAGAENATPRFQSPTTATAPGPPPTAEELAQAFLELLDAQPDLDDKTRDKVTLVATVLIGSVSGGNHQKAMRIVEEASALPALRKATSSTWLADYIAEFVPSGQSGITNPGGNNR